ncbi:MAG TPA: HPF/RaiA family ribosome-associated protein [Burkholderiaceae bacterium]|nr:HPF/RaiA family ribosome-associated protein [Burkholderiaceae bacterium]
MQIQINTNESVQGSATRFEWIESEARDALERFEDDVTRVEIHLNDVNADKEGGRDQRCMMEARIAGLASVAVTEYADSLPDAVRGAAEKLRKALDSKLGKLHDSAKRERESIRRDPDLI